MLPLIAIFSLLGWVEGLPLSDLYIINGENATLGEFPFMVSIRWIYGGKPYHNCGGSILDETHILTAGHCVFSESPEKFSIQYGVVKTNESMNAPNVILVENYTIHKYFRISDLFHDVAVIKLKTPIPFSENVRPVQLPSPDAPSLDNQEAQVIGWGDTGNSSITNNQLKKVTVEIFPAKECKKIFLNNDPPFNPAFSLCSGVPGGGKGQCSGDSGGPLLVNGVQIGIVSWSMKPCANAAHPPVQQKVLPNLKWISEQLKN